MLAVFRNYLTITIYWKIVGTVKVDYGMQYYDVITNPRWRT